MQILQGVCKLLTSTVCVPYSKVLPYILFKETMFLMFLVNDNNPAAVCSPDYKAIVMSLSCHVQYFTVAKATVAW